MFVADGYGNRRVAVIDADSGKIKRFWGAYGNKPDDKAAAAQGAYDPAVTYQQFRGPVHCAEVPNDGLVYVCDRTSNRIQVFKLDGTYVREVYMQRDTRGDGVDLGRGLLARRAAAVPLRGRRPQPEDPHLRSGDHDRADVVRQGRPLSRRWYSLHSVATDSKGNLYTVETYRAGALQRFLYKGLAPVPPQQPGVGSPTGRRPVGAVERRGLRLGWGVGPTREVGALARGAPVPGAA